MLRPTTRLTLSLSISVHGLKATTLLIDNGLAHSRRKSYLNDILLMLERPNF